MNPVWMTGFVKIILLETDTLIDECFININLLIRRENYGKKIFDFGGRDFKCQFSK